MHCSIGIFVLAAATLSIGPAVAQEPTVRSTAVVALSFDETDGAAEDRAEAGATQDNAQPRNGVARVSSPFWNVRGGRAARFDAAKNQFFQVAHSGDTSHSDGTTLSFYFLNLHEPAEAAFRGIVAKRHPTENKTNYGLNFQPSSGRLQVYVHDGTSYKVVAFPLEQAFGRRRLVHLTATFRRGRAPGSEGEGHDLEIRLIVNGRPLKPLDATGGIVTDDAGWIPNVNFAGMVSDTALTIGASFPNGEGVSGLIDEFLLFDRPLSIEDAAKLFAEVAGPNGEELARLETEPELATKPVITDIAPRGLEVGATTRLTISGQNLGPEPVLSLLDLAADVDVKAESTAERLVIDVTLPEVVAVPVVPLAVRTAAGISDALPMPIDTVQQRLMSDTLPDQPAALPAAFTGMLNGSDQPRLMIEGRAGQLLLAEVELKRFGSAADPVLELKSNQGTPLAIAWGQSRYGGDARLVTTLPYDGHYALELHDLAYQAPKSQFRLRTALDERVPEIRHVSQAAEPEHLWSEPQASDELIDVTAAGPAATYINGRLVERGELDRIRIRVEPGQPLEIRVEAKSIGSAVDPMIAVFEQEQEILRQSARPGVGTVLATLTPQTNEIEIHVADRLRGMDGDYRLRIAPADTPEFDVTLLDPTIILPQTGRGVARLRVRRGGSAGTIRIAPVDASGVVIEPAVFPQGRPNEEHFVTIAARPDRKVGSTLTLTAEAETPHGPLRRPVRVSPGPAVERYDSSIAYFEAPIVTGAPAPEITLARAPAAAFKGVTETIGLTVTGGVPEEYAVRFSLVSDEPPRPNEPRNPAAGTKPRISLPDDAAVPSGVTDAAVGLKTPLDVAVGRINAVIKAEVVPHAWSNRIAAVGYSAPFRLPVREPIAAVERIEPMPLQPGDNKIKILVQRERGFRQPVRVELRGLPQGFQAAAVDIPPSQTEATLTLTVPQNLASALTNVELAVLGSDGTVLKSIPQFSFEVSP